MRTSLRRSLFLGALSVALSLAWGASLPAPGGAAETRVELVRTGTVEDVDALIASVGGVVEVRSDDRIQALVPASAVPVLQRATSVVSVDTPGLFVPLQALTASTLVGADGWLDGGLTGRGVKVAVLDTGFAGYEQALGATLPKTVTVRSFRPNEDVAGAGDHGRRAAEIVHSLAPGAQLYLVAFSTVTEMSAAVDYLLEQDVDVVSFSIGYIHNGPGDGTGPVDRIVTRATRGDMAWAVGAGNWAQQHWAGVFRDDNRDAIHEYRPGVQDLTHFFSGGDLITLSLRWEDTWGGACSDYDLELFSPRGALVRSSRGIQDCSGNPVESLQVLATEAGNYAARVVRGNTTAPRRIDVIFVGSPDRGAGVSVPVPAGSLGAPADHPDVLSVGALTNALVRSEAPYSSRGPTSDGRAKPELLAPTGIGVNGGETFAGTSAAAPHVAAAMALLREALPGTSRERLFSELRARGGALPAVQDGSAGARRLDLSSTAGIGPLLPAGAERARLDGAIAEGAGMAAVVYHGPDGYPLRFLHRLTGGREIGGAWVFDRARNRWQGFVMDVANEGVPLDRVTDGDPIVLVLR